MIDIGSRVREVLDKGYLMSLGTVDDGGVWVADIVYVADDELNIYWMSNPDFRHSKAIAKNAKVAGTITVSQKQGDLDFAVQLEGAAEKLDGARLTIATKFLMKKGKPGPSKVLNILMKGYSWYKLVPTKIELIDQKNFDFQKQKISL